MTNGSDAKIRPNRTGAAALTFTTLWLAAQLVLIRTAAAAGPQPASYTLSNPLRAGNPAELVGRIVSMFIGVVGSFALLMFVYGGLTLLTSRGNPEQVQKGKKIFIWAVIGLTVIFTAYIVLRNIFHIIGASD